MAAFWAELCLVAILLVGVCTRALRPPPTLVPAKPRAICRLEQHPTGVACGTGTRTRMHPLRRESFELPVDLNHATLAENSQASSSHIGKPNNPKKKTTSNGGNNTARRSRRLSIGMAW